jgi:hypothetical protein
MSLKIHAVVQNADDFDPAVVYDVEEDEMAGAARPSCGMHRIEAVGDFRARSRASDRRTFTQTRERVLEDAFVGARLSLAELVRCPKHNVLQIRFGGKRQPDVPRAA